MRISSTTCRTASGPRKLAIVSFALATLFLGLLMALTAQAADRETFMPEALRDPALVLTRALVAEAGYRVRVDHPAILHVLHRRAGRGTPVDDARMAVRYCSVFKRETPRAQRLRAAPWPYFERRAPGVTSLAKRWVRGDRIGDPCRGKARHWGSTQDMERLDLRGRVLASCGPTANVFLVK